MNRNRLSKCAVTLELMIQRIAAGWCSALLRLHTVTMIGSQLFFIADMCGSRIAMPSFGLLHPGESPHLKGERERRMTG